MDNCCRFAQEYAAELPQTPRNYREAAVTPELWRAFGNGDDIIPPTLMFLICSHVRSNLISTDVCERFLHVLGTKLAEFPHNVIACDDHVVTTVLACMLAHPRVNTVQYYGVQTLKGLCRDPVLQTQVFGQGGFQIVSAAKSACPASSRVANELLSNFLGRADGAAAQTASYVATH